MKIVKKYSDRNEFLSDDIKNDYRALHQDIEDGELKVTWVNGIDDPVNLQVDPEKETMTERKFIEMLAEQHNIKIQFSFRDSVRQLLGL